MQVPPDSDYYTSGPCVSPARSCRKRRQILQRRQRCIPSGGDPLWRSLNIFPAFAVWRPGTGRRLLRYDRRKPEGPAPQVQAGSRGEVPRKKMKLRWGTELPKKEGYMFNEFNDNI